MLLAPKYEGLNLPVHDPETFVVTELEMLHSARLKRDAFKNYTAPTFVRAVMVQLRDLSDAPRSAAELLKRTDEELKKVAGLCGALVAGYEWGLYPVHERGHAHRRYLPADRGFGGLISLPKNHILVAEVDVVKPARLWLSDDELREAEIRSLDNITAGVHRYYEEGLGTYQLTDMRQTLQNVPRIDQFVLGAPVGSPQGQPVEHLVDIEPRFRLTR